MSEKRYKSSSKTELAQAYNIRRRTLRLWMKPIEEELGAYVGKAYNPKQIEQIVTFLGEPEKAEYIIA